MIPASFRALVVTEQASHYVPAIQELSLAQLPAGELLIKVRYSSLNYKDALSAVGNKGVTRRYPHVLGIDVAGVVVQSTTPAFAEGAEVLVTGFDLGMNTWGGLGEYIRVPMAWALPLPAGLSAREAMSFGTAGLTAGLAVRHLLQAGLSPDRGEIAVSGATGGVGSLATAILAQLGFAVVAVSGKDDPAFLLATLGARRVLSRAEFTTAYDQKPLATPVFAGGLDTVGGALLSGMLKATHYAGLVTCCGMVAGPDLTTSIFPFILRGVQLIGIDSVQALLAVCQHVWQQLVEAGAPRRAHARNRVSGSAREAGRTAGRPSPRPLRGGAPGLTQPPAPHELSPHSRVTRASFLRDAGTTAVTRVPPRHAAGAGVPIAVALSAPHGYPRVPAQRAVAE